MKAIHANRYGGPRVLQLREVDKPVPTDDEMLVKVCASSINSADYRTMRAKPFFVRLMGEGLLRPKHRIPGIDMAGVVEAVGRNISLFQPGDEIYGDVYSAGTGAYSEYICIPETANVTRKPQNMTFAQAAAVPVAGLTALQALRDYGKAKPGDAVLINGASGGVGTFCVTIAKAYGGIVTGVCSTRNLDLVASIGADHVVDYTRQKTSSLTETFDVIIDVAANLTPADYRRMLKPGGRGVLVGYSSMLGMLQIMRKGKKAKSQGIQFGMMGMAKASKQELTVLREMMESGRMIPAIDRVYPLAEAAEAMRYFEQEHARAKIILSMCGEAEG